LLCRLFSILIEIAIKSSNNNKINELSELIKGNYSMFKKQESAENATPTSLRPGGGNSPSLSQESTSSTSTAGSTGPTASIGPSIRINGDIAGNENLVIHGQVAGSISLPNNMLTIGKQGSVDADVSAKNVEIEGKVSGTVQAAEIVKVNPSGQVKGDIAAPRVVLEDGCQFRGGIDMQEQKLAGESKSTDATKAKANGATPPAGKSQSNFDNTAKA